MGRKHPQVEQATCPGPATADLAAQVIIERCTGAAFDRSVAGNAVADLQQCRRQAIAGRDDVQDLRWLIEPPAQPLQPRQRDRRGGPRRRDAQPEFAQLGSLGEQFAIAQGEGGDLLRRCAIHPDIEQQDLFVGARRLRHRHQDSGKCRRPAPSGNGPAGCIRVCQHRRQRRLRPYRLSPPSAVVRRWSRRQATHSAASGARPPARHRVIGSPRAQCRGRRRQSA